MLLLIQKKNNDNLLFSKTEKKLGLKIVLL